MRITLATIDDLRRKLDELPPQAATHRAISKQEAVALLAKEVAALQNRGYTMDEIANVLSNNGLPVAVSTLKSYLSRAKSPSKKASTKPRHAAQGKSAATAVDADESTSKNGKRNAAEVPRETAARTDVSTGVRSSSFMPREDSISI